jgi:hypothetical protein
MEDNKNESFPKVLIVFLGIVFIGYLWAFFDHGPGS